MSGFKGEGWVDKRVKGGVKGGGFKGEGWVDKRVKVA